jgi:hypothetical protein
MIYIFGYILAILLGGVVTPLVLNWIFDRR